jgi:hypothetical protein
MRPSSRPLTPLCILLVAFGCAPPSEAAGPQSEKMATGRACAAASTACEPGRCVATIENQCDLPVTCRMSIESQCDAGGVSGPANASTKQVTQLAKTTNMLEASTQCSQGAPVLTKVTALECI